jgi:hypothetical protein
MSNITLQINLAPSDWLHACHILPHQLRQFAGQVDEVLLTLDLHRSPGRFSEGWEERLPKIEALIQECCQQYTHVRSLIVDYSPKMISAVSQTFFGDRLIPAKDFRGGPFYSYFYGLYSARHDYVFHIDSDLMFGGGSQTWIQEAIQFLQTHPKVLVCGPLPGAPSLSETLYSQSAHRFPYSSLAFQLDEMSTRYFLFDRARFRQQIEALPLPYAAPWGFIKAILEGNPPYCLPEEIFSKMMAKQGLLRVEFLGQAQGMWSLHPPYRCADFYDRLPELIQCIETGNIPDAQRGYHDVNESLIDWSIARRALKQNRWWKRLAKRWQQSQLQISPAKQ